MSVYLIIVFKELIFEFSSYAFKYDFLPEVGVLYYTRITPKFKVKENLLQYMFSIHFVRYILCGFALEFSKLKRVKLNSYLDEGSPLKEFEFLVGVI